jgi:hypothetical protein
MIISGDFEEDIERLAMDAPLANDCFLFHCRRSRKAHRPGIAPKHRMQLDRSFLFFGARLADLSQLHATKNEAINVQGGTDSMHE